MFSCLHPLPSDCVQIALLNLSFDKMKVLIKLASLLQAITVLLHGL